MALAFATGVSAQTAAPAPTAAQTSQQSDHATVLGEVVVTATRRPEFLHDVPLSVSAFSEADIARAQVNDNRNLVLLTPGLRMEATNLFVTPTIRGVTTTLVGSNADPNVATYVDGIYQQFSQSAIFVLPDVKQVEVLKGPQGTLFGRNATGGAILITTRDPSFSETSGEAEASYASYNDFMGKAFVNVPINDKLAGSITVFGEHREGWYKLTAYGGETGGGLEDTLVRAKLRYAPTKDIDLILTGLVSRQLDRSQGMNETLYGNNNRLPAPGVFTAITPYDYAGNVKPYTDTMTQAASLRATVAAGPGHFTSTTAYQAVQSPLVTDSDNTNVAFQDNWQRPESRTISQEVLYTLENTGRLHGTTGVYYYNNKNSHLVNVNPGPGGLYAIDGGNVRHIHEHSEAWAVFGEFTYDVTSKLSLTGGLRYSRETRHGDAMQWVTTAGVTTLVNTLPPVEKTWSAWTPRVSAVYSFDERHNVYFTYSKGFKSGLFNVVGLQKAPVEPEDIRSYEVGSKNRFADFTFDVAAFYYDYRNLQVQSLIQIPPSISFVSLVNNAATSKIYGLEANLDWRVTSELSANAGLSLLHARYENYPTANATVPFSSPGVASCNFQSYTPFLVGGYKSLTCDASGKKMLRSPDATFDLAVNYEKETQVGTFDLSAIFYWTTTIYYDPIDYVKQPAYSTINAQVSFRPAGREHLKFSLFGTNLNDARYLESVQESTASILVRYAAPRQIGVKVGYSF